MAADFSQYFAGITPDQVVDVLDFKVVKDGHGAELGHLMNQHQDDSPADLARLLGCTEDVAEKVRYWCTSSDAQFPPLDRAR